MKKRIWLILASLLLVFSFLGGCGHGDDDYDDEYYDEEWEDDEYYDDEYWEDEDWEDDEYYDDEDWEDDEYYDDEEWDDEEFYEEDWEDDDTSDGLTASVKPDGQYTSKDEVALYIHTYQKLPSNYITKKEAQNKGWDSKSGNLNKVAPGCSIGGDFFGNYEGLLPEKKGRKYYECDIDFDGGYRNSKRIIYSNDGLIYYTDDHYNSFTQLY